MPIIQSSAFMASLFISLAVAPATAHDFRIRQIRIDHPWSRATPPVAAVAGGYLTLINEGQTPDRLVSISSPLAERVEIHESRVVDGVARMRPLPDGLSIPAGTTAELKPGQTHIMFIKPIRPLNAEAQFPATLSFEKAGSIDVIFYVQALGADGHAGHEVPSR